MRRINDDIELTTEDDNDRDVSVIIDISAYLEAERLRAIRVARERRRDLQGQLAQVRKRPAPVTIPVSLTVYQEPRAKWPLMAIALGLVFGVLALWWLEPVAMIANGR